MRRDLIESVKGFTDADQSHSGKMNEEFHWTWISFLLLLMQASCGVSVLNFACELKDSE